jgi:hypothetical protein
MSDFDFDVETEEIVRVTPMDEVLSDEARNEYAFNWLAVAIRHNLDRRRLERVAERIYYANWRELRSERFPPSWDATSSVVRDFVRNQSAAVLSLEIEQ